MLYPCSPFSLDATKKELKVNSASPPLTEYFSKDATKKELKDKLDRLDNRCDFLFDATKKDLKDDFVCLCD